MGRCVVEMLGGERVRSGEDVQKKAVTEMSGICLCSSTHFLSSMKSRDEHNVVLVLQLVVQLSLRFRKHTKCSIFKQKCPSLLIRICVLLYVPAGVQSMTKFSFHLHPELRPVIESMDSN